MELLDRFKNAIGTFILERQLASNHIERNFISLDKALEIGIIYDATDKSKEATVHSYADKLRSEGKNVFLQGYIDLKSLPENKNNALRSEYFSRNSLTPFHLPDKSKSGQFQELPFDLLLNLYEKPLLPMLALSGYSKAKYRVGPKMENGLRYFDAIIDTAENNQLDFLISQVDFYLRVIPSAPM